VVSIISVELNLCLPDLLAPSCYAMAEWMYAERPVNSLLSSYGAFPGRVKPTVQRMQSRY
jgi:hypothetical protein